MLNSLRTGDMGTGVAAGVRAFGREAGVAADASYVSV